MTDRSISFDRAAEFYDRTRGLSSAALAEMAAMLVRELDGRRPVLEIGVGTGLVALPLSEVGVQMVGVDLSSAMVRKLMEKAGGAAPFPLVFADATRLPLRDDSFRAAIARHVLHLIPEWKAAVEELARVVRAGGRLLMSTGYPDTGPWREVGDHLEGILGQQSKRVGFQADDAEQLDTVIESLGGKLRGVPTIWETSDLTIERYLRETGEGIYSWTWGIDPDDLRSALDDTRTWAVERFGSLDVVLEPRFPMNWRVYDLS